MEKSGYLYNKYIQMEQPQKYKRTVLLVVGITILVVCSGSIPFLVLFTVPVLIMVAIMPPIIILLLLSYIIAFIGMVIGIIFIWLSDRESLIKLLWSLIPIPVLIICTMICYMIGANTPAFHHIYTSRLPETKHTSEIYLIPENYRGKVNIVFNESCGQTPIEENGSMVYTVPANGILITTDLEQDEYDNNRTFFLVDKYENRTLLPVINLADSTDEWETKQPEDPLRNLLAVFDSVGNVQAGSISDGNSRRYRVYSFEVGTYNELPNDYQRDESDDILRKAIQRCRYPVKKDN